MFRVLSRVGATNIAQVVILLGCIGTTAQSSLINAIKYETISAERGQLTFEVHQDVSFDYVNLYFIDSNSGSVSSSPYVCMATDMFEGGQNHSCIIPGLSANTEYNITIQGHDPDMANATHPGLTEQSETFTISQGGTFSLSCETDSYSIEFYFGDLSPSKNSVSFSTTTVQSSADGSPFDEQTVIQSHWNDEAVFVPPVELTRLFRGFPSAISVQSDDNNITALFSEYHFIDTPVVNGNSDTYDANLKETFNLTNRRVVTVNGSFTDGVLSSIQFVAEDGASPCYGVSDCSGFSSNQAGGGYLVGFAGKTDDGGSIVELSLRWASVSMGTYYVNLESCEVESDPHWNDIVSSRYFYTVDPFSACGTTQRVLNSDHTVVYENVVSQQTGGDPASAETFGEGSVTVSRGLSAGVSLKCTYEGEEVVTSHFTTTGEEAKVAVDTHALQFQMLFYTDNSYTNSHSSGDVLSATIGQPLYFGVSFKDEIDYYNMTLYAHMCYAKQNSDPEVALDGSDYLLLEENGCPADDDSFTRVEAARSAAHEKLDSLSITTFYWFNDENALVYIHCKVRACPEENKDQCQPPSSCDEKRARRDVGSVEGFPMDAFASSQPLMLHKPTDILVSPRKSFMDTRAWIPLTVFCGIMAALMLIILRAFHNQRNQFTYHRVKAF